MARTSALLITIIMAVALIMPVHLSAQSDSKTPFFFSLDYRTGKNKPHRPIIANLTYPYRGVEFKMGWQTLGKQPWQQAYRYPSFGIGVNWNTFKTDVLGDPFAAYFFTNFPQVTLPWARLDLEVDFGASYGIHPYDSITNPHNYSTGSAINVIFGLYLEQSFDVGKHIDLFVSEGFTHYSNGALGFPNLGLNIPSLKFGVRYQPNFVERIPKSPRESFHPKWQINTYLGTGMKTLFTPTPYYHEYLVAPTLYLRTSYKRRVGIGYELAYNEAIRGIYEQRNYTGKQLITSAIYASHEFIIERFTVVTQFGIYVKNQPSDKFYYERIGMGFYLTPSIRMVLNLKAHYFKAEYVETGLIFDLPLF